MERSDSFFFMYMSNFIIFVLLNLLFILFSGNDMPLFFNSNDSVMWTIPVCCLHSHFFSVIIDRLNNTSATCTQANGVHKSTPSPRKWRKHLENTQRIHECTIAHDDKNGSLWNAQHECIFSCKMIMNYWNNNIDDDNDDNRDKDRSSSQRMASLFCYQYPITYI